MICKYCGKEISPYESHYIILGDHYCEICYNKIRDMTPEETKVPYYNPEDWM